MTNKNLKWCKTQITNCADDLFLRGDKRKAFKAEFMSAVALMRDGDTVPILGLCRCVDAEI